MENIFSPKFFKVSKVKFEYDYFLREKSIKRFENGNFIYYCSSKFIILDINLKEIYKKNIDNIKAFSIINDKEFIALYNEGIYLFSEIDNQEISHNEASKLLMKDYKIETIYKFKFYETLQYIHNFIYNKKYMIINGVKHFYFFKIKLKNKKVSLQSKLKFDDSIVSVILFRNKYLILKMESNNKNLICYNFKTMKEILPRFNVRKKYYLIFKFFFPSVDIYNLYNYNDKSFILVDYEYLNFYDFDKKEIYYSFGAPDYHPKFINLSKNYLFIGYDYSLYIYNKNNFKYLQCKRISKHEDEEKNDFICADEINDKKILIFGMNNIFSYKKDSISHYIFLSINTIIIFILFKILIKYKNSAYDIFWELYHHHRGFGILLYIIIILVIININRNLIIFHISDYL